VARPYIGCKTLELNSSLAAELKANSPSFPDLAAGIYVPYVHPGGPADRAGLLPGDVITGFPGQPLSAKGLTQALAQCMGGAPLPLSVTHADGSRATVHVAATDVMQARQ
jgi:S1-C subfamily serine protease